MGNPESGLNLFSTNDNVSYCNKYTIGQFNVNGWFSAKNPYYTEFKLNVLKCINVEIVILCETHCINDQVLKINDYTVYQHNRQPKGGGRHGSGGVAIGLKNSLLFTHEILGLYKTFDGIIGIKLRNIYTDYTIGIMGNYLSPDNYHYGRDAETYFNYCSVLWDTLSDCDLRVGTGDYNARTKQLVDYLPDIDGNLVPPRTNLDNVQNSHGDSFVTFLKDNRSIILNGRVTPQFNNFTFVTPRGASVPDYMICPIDNLNNCNEFKVLLMRDIVNTFGLQPPQNLPDHSFLFASFSTYQFSNENTEQNPTIKINSQPLCKRPQKKNLKSIDRNFFMSDEIFQQVLFTIQHLETTVNNQNEINVLWGEVKTLFLSEMAKLPNLPSSNVKSNKNKFRKSQPFWNDELENYWKEVCWTEKAYLSFKVSDKSLLNWKAKLRNDYKLAQKTFDKKFRFFKRQFKKKDFEDLSNSASNNPSEMWAKVKRLCDPPSSRAALEIVRADGTISNDVKEILERWHRDISRLFSGMRENPEMAFDNKFYEDICNKKREFEDISPEEQSSNSNFNSDSLNSELSFQEVSKGIDSTNLRKAYLEIPNEVTKNKNAKMILHKFFNLCFSSGLNPTDWDYSNIKPIPKKDKDPRDPLNNRCITIMCCVSKIYSKILNSRLQKYLEENNILVEEQNGFRASRSCIDHIYTLCTILRNRKALGFDTFLAFIDYQKAFDSVDRRLLLYKLSQIGVVGKFYSAISSLYLHPKSRVILNEFETEYFDCPIGVKQGDCLSPTLFAIFINDLAEEIKLSGVGLDLDADTFVNILMYADDIVLLAKNEEDLQFLLLIVENWCLKWRLEVNLTKTNIMHVRAIRKCQSKFMFLFDRRPVPYCTSYKYLGCTINENLDFSFTVKMLADSAGRALGSIVTKMIKNGGFPFNVFTTLYKACVCSISDYGGEIFGNESFDSALKIHLRAARSFLGVPKTTSTPGVLSEINWLLPKYRTQLKMIRQYHRIIKLPNTSLTKKVYFWDKNLNDENQLITWTSEVKNIFSANNLAAVFESGNIFDLKLIIENLQSSMMLSQQNYLEDECSILKSPKLRTFITFKDFGTTPSYITKPLSFIQRKFMAKLRLGCLEIRIETGRYARPRLPEEARICQVCENPDQEIENEFHFIFKCEKYRNERSLWINKLQIPNNFETLPPNVMLSCVLNDHNNVKLTAQYIVNIYDIRSKIVNNLPSTNNIFHLLPHDQCPACTIIV